MKVSQQDYESIKTEAKRLGFCLVGTAQVKKPAQFELYKKWVDKNLYGDMSYLARIDSIAKRENPQLLLKKAKSFIVLGFPYPMIEFAGDYKSFSGRIAAYARIPDYHVTLETKMAELVERIRMIIGTDFFFRSYSDSSPILEKELAVEAGFGWIGKNSCLITPEFGSFFLLSEILTNLEFGHQENQITDHCGKCSKCIQACPTKCILVDRTISANRCISYLTIEHKGVIPAEYRSSIGSNIFGCDICQLVCPWNQNLISFATHPIAGSVDSLPDLLPMKENISISEVEFSTKFSRFPVARGKRARLLRNIATSAGNDRSTDLQLLITAARREKDPLIRAHLYWAIGKNHDAKSGLILRSFQKTEKDPIALLEIIQTLENEPGS